MSAQPDTPAPTAAADEFIGRYLNREDDRFLGYIPYADPPAPRNQASTVRTFANRVASWFGGGPSAPTSAAFSPGVSSPQPKNPTTAAMATGDDEETDDADYYASLTTDSNGNPIGDAVKSVDDGLPIRDFIYASSVGRLYYATRDAICAPFGFYHGQRVGIRRGPLAGMRVVILGVHGGLLHGIFEGETEASPFLRCYHQRHLMDEYDLVALTSPRAVKIQPLTLPEDVPQQVHNFLMYAPDLTLEINLDQNLYSDEDSEPITKAKPVPKKTTTAATASPAANSRRSISFAEGPAMHVDSSPSGKTKKAGSKRQAREEEDEDNIDWLLDDHVAADGASPKNGNNEIVVGEDDAAAFAVPVDPFREVPTPRPNTVRVYLTPTYSIEHSGSIGWSGEAMQPISGAGGVGRVPLYNTKKRRTALSASKTALQKQREYLESRTQPVLASISATIIVPLVLSFRAVETLASTVETVEEVLDSAVEKSDAAKAKAVKLHKEAKEKLGIVDAEDEAAEFLRRNQAEEADE